MDRGLEMTRLRRQTGGSSASPSEPTDIDVDRIRTNLARIREQAGPDVEILAATKYIRSEAMGALADAGIELVGENRLQDLEEKQEQWEQRFTWDFIGNLQSRKVKRIVPRVRLIHSVATDSVLEQLGRHGDAGTEVLIEVNLSGEEGKGGVEPSALDDFIERCPVKVSGLMTMPPFTEDPEDSRPYFGRLAELASDRGLARLSMGTSQDWQVAVEEGATIVRLGSVLWA
jgi:PLP dependent protein